MKREGMASRIVIAILGILLIGTGVAWNASALLGNDPVGILYDGVRSIGNLTGEQLGIASNIVNIALVVLLFFIGRRYVNIGTFIYILPYGVAVDLGTKMYQFLFHGNAMGTRILAAATGCLLLYIGIAIYIVVDIGLDPFTGVVMVIKDALHLEYRKVKIGFDLCLIAIGFLLGGKLGVITIITALSAGPCIQFFATQFKKVELQLMKMRRHTNPSFE